MGVGRVRYGRAASDMRARAWATLAECWLLAGDLDGARQASARMEVSASVAKLWNSSNQIERRELRIRQRRPPHRRPLELREEKSPEEPGMCAPPLTPCHLVVLLAAAGHVGGAESPETGGLRFRAFHRPFQAGRAAGAIWTHRRRRSYSGYRRFAE